MSSIKHLIAMKMKDILQAACVDAIPTDDKTRVNLVAIRSAGSAITGKRLILVIKHMDPLDPIGWSDSTVGARDQGDTMGSHFPAAVFGRGGTQPFDKIKGVVEVTGQLTISKENVEQADEYIQEVLARVKATLRKNQNAFTTLKDSYGESVYQFTVVGSTEYDSGGDNSNTTRFFVRWLAVTLTGADQGA